MSADVAGAVEITAGFDGSNRPRHVGIIMDGNGRWAGRRGLPRTEGHRQGLEALKAAVRHAIKTGLQYMTVFSFSSENWSRPADEVEFLLRLLKKFVRSDLTELHKQNVRIRIIGRRSNLTPDILALVEEAESLTRDNTGLTLCVAFNYGARDEILRASEKLALAHARGEVSALEMTQEGTLGRFMDTAGIPDPDLIIRTSGEKRLSNFLLWQAAYAEFVFLDILWPDFSAEHFDKALTEYACRERRYGGIG